MHFVPIKQVEQQDIQSLHRVRSRLIKNRTALINEIRGLNLEYGIAIPLGALKVKSHLRSIIDDPENELTVLTRELMQELYDELIEMEKRLNTLEPTFRTNVEDFCN
jgi:transposase